MPALQPIALKDLGVLPPASIAKLASLGICDAAQLLGMTNSASGVEAVAQELALDVPATQAMLTALKSKLDPQFVREAQQQLDTSRFGLGVNG